MAFQDSCSNDWSNARYTIHLCQGIVAITRTSIVNTYNVHADLHRNKEEILIQIVEVYFWTVSVLEQSIAVLFGNSREFLYIVRFVTREKLGTYETILKFRYESRITISGNGRVPRHICVIYGRNKRTITLMHARQARMQGKLQSVRCSRKI